MTISLSDLMTGARNLLPMAVSLRRKVHAYPELGLELPMTVAAVKESLQGLDVDIRQSNRCTGLVVTVKGGQPGKTILIRGDMDALPMPEDTDLEFKSTIPGRMHACGHDSHTAMLAAAVHLVHNTRDQLKGTAKFMFQPGEEGYFGARVMIEDGLFDHGPKPDAAFAIHITPNAPAGILTSKPGPVMAAVDEIEVQIVARGGHASMPHNAVDPVPIAAEMVMAFQALVTRRINAFDPVVLTIGKLAAGTTDNVIPEKAELLGTLRSFSEESRRAAKEGIERIVTHIAAAHKAEAKVIFHEGYPVTVNDAGIVDFAAKLAGQLIGPRAYIEMPSPVMGAEDWSYVLQKVPGAMFFLGVAPAGCNHSAAAPCHSNRMMMDEDAMAHGIAMHAAMAHHWLAQAA